MLMFSPPKICNFRDKGSFKYYVTLFRHFFDPPPLVTCCIIFADPPCGVTYFVLLENIQNVLKTDDLPLQKAQNFPENVT